MLHALLDRQFYKVERAFDVDIYIMRGVLNRRARSGHGRQVDNTAYRFGGEKVLKRISVAQVGVYQPEIGVGHKRRSVLVLALRIVIIVEVAERNPPPPTTQQRLSRVGADKPRTTR